MNTSAVRGYVTSGTTGECLHLHTFLPHRLSYCPRLETDISPGDMVQVNAQFDETRGCYVVDNAGPGSVIVNPDQLISGTTVAAGVTCARR